MPAIENFDPDDHTQYARQYPKSISLSVLRFWRICLSR